jgi:RND family efflux transporter MFP subunit
MGERFEREFAAWLGVPDAVMTSSGTTALHLGVRMLGWGEGDEVVTSPFSFVASANCLLYEGAKPVFVDVEEETLDIDPAAAADAVGERTAGILPVHIFGYPAAMPELEALAQKHGLGILEDACEALGAVDSEGRAIGARGNLATFAFYANKQMTTGEGGMIVPRDPGEAARLRVKLILQLVGTFLMQRDFRDAAMALVTDVASQLGCDRVTLASLERGRLRVEAVSHASQFDARSNLLTATVGAMTEALDQGEAVVHPTEREERLVVTQAHAELAQLAGGAAVASFPLMHNGHAVGALTLERAQGARFDAQTIELVEGLAGMLGPLVELQRARHQSLPAHAAQSALDLRARLFGPRHGGFKLGAAALVLLAVFLAFAKGAYRVGADARIEGEIQRAITAPFQGYVREAVARAGDAVKQGQIMARLDDRDLRVERARLGSQREQLAQQYRDAMARQERSQVRIVSAQIAQAEAQIALLDEQLARTEVSAPFDGVVVSGDLTQALGAPLERGQVMFEVAPLDAYRIVLQVGEQDIADVRVGQAGELALTPMPGERYPLKVVKITPVSTAKDGRNVFRVEAELAARDGARLRPGMEGVAKVDVDERRLASIWTRRLTDWLALKSWSWLP